jgi:hypothetical protein
VLPERALLPLLMGKSKCPIITHVWLAWRNGLNCYLSPKGKPRKAVQQQLGKLLMKLLRDVLVYEDTIVLYKMEIEYWRSIGHNVKIRSERQGSDTGVGKKLGVGVC